MKNCTIIGIDTAKSSFALHGADGSGATVFRKTLTRAKLLPFLEKQPPCTVALESCAGSHHWAREIQALRHRVMLIPPIYVKPFVKRQKNDANDAAAIVEAASRPSMRTVAAKSRDTQARTTLFRCRALLVRQRSQIANSIRGLLVEFGVIAPRGLAQVSGFRKRIAASGSPVPELAVESLETLFDQMERLSADIDKYDTAIKEEVTASEDAQRYMTIPGIGPITSFALLAFAGDMQQFRNGRQFSAWLGLTPKEHSTGGKVRLGGITKMGQRDLRSLLVQGAMSVYQFRKDCGLRSADIAGAGGERKHPKVIAVAWANRMARIAWALHHHREDYDPAHPNPAREEAKRRNAEAKAA